MKKGISISFSLGLLSLIIVISGCGFDNTMYNARKYYKSAQAKPLGANGKPSPQAIDEYTKTIKKCGYILTERKNSPEADDALFLLAQALYFKGNSQFQAKDQFESLIKNFPDSPFVADSKLFLARISRQINKPKDADVMLESFIRDPANLTSHAKALFIMADFAIQDKDFIKAQYWLEKILTDYPQTKEFKEAFYLSGKLYYEQKDFVKSLEQFQKLTWARGIDRYVKLDSRYYIALSQLETNEPSKAWQTIKKLIADEDRVDKANLYNVLKGRILFAQNKDDKANELLEGIVKNSPRTLFSAEACYWLAEYHYRKQHDISKAVESYNKVKTEAALSPFANDAGSKAAALGLIITGASMQPDDNPQAYVDNRLAVAENFFMVFALPDSVLHVFTQLDSIPQFIQHKADSLTVRLDSLNIARLALAEYAQTDSMQADSSSVKQHADSLQSEILLPKPPIDTMPDSLSAEPDTLKLTNNVISDSLELHISTAADSLVQFQQAAKIRYSTLGQEISAIETELKAIAVTQTAYQEQFLPYAMFVEASMVKRGLADSTMIADIYRDMLNRFPVNKYTNALRMLIEGEQVRLVDPALDVIESQMDTALANIESTPDSAVVSLTELSHSSYPQIAIKANFRLGWYYTFETPDTLVAKPYFDEVLKLDRTGDYGSLVTRFYTGTKYSFPKLDFGTFDSLLVRIKRADSLAAVRADSLAAAKADSIAASEKGKHHKKEKDKQPTEVDDLPETLSPDSQPVLKEEEHLLPEPKPSR